MSRFSDCLHIVLRFEGGFVNDPLDHGGATNFGITQRVYDAHREQALLPPRSVELIEEHEVSQIYHQEFWDACRCDEVPQPLDLCIFDAAVQHGPRRAVKWLQNLVGAMPDGAFGDKTMYALNQQLLEHRLEVLVEDYMTARKAFYAGIIASDPTQQKFAKGWSNRVASLELHLA